LKQSSLARLSERLDQALTATGTSGATVAAAAATELGDDAS
jgi:hypothetical protein